MSNNDKAIIIPASINVLKEHKLGSVVSHVLFLSKKEAVFWSLVSKGETFLHPEIKKGYFYEPYKKGIEFSFDIAFIKSYEEIESPELFEVFVPPFRRYQSGFYWVLITQIYQSDRLHTLDKFRKYEDDQPVQRVENYVICKEYKNFVEFDLN